jgi:hypothetical protein
MGRKTTLLFPNVRIKRGKHFFRGVGPCNMGSTTTGILAGPIDGFVVDRRSAVVERAALRTLWDSISVLMMHYVLMGCC